jgi:uncharacterized cupredoxin-like copper-binding protein
MFRFTTPILLIAGALLLAACGEDGASSPDAGAPADRTIRVDMVDLAFEPADLTVRAGETVRFVFTNSGEVPHDAFIGDAEEQADHAAEMDGMHGHGADDEGITVEPGERAELIRTFTTADDDVLLGCHQPGHYDAGMVAGIEVR